MTKVFVHAGSHKTGTTAIQDFSSRSEGWLRDRGLVYPNLEIIGKRNRRSHLDTFDALVGKVRARGDDTLDEADARRFVEAAIHDAVRDGHDVLLSAESLFRFSERMTETVHEVLRDVVPDEAEVVWVVALRSQAPYAESLYRNSFRAFSKRPPEVRKWLRNRLWILDYEQVLHRLTDGGRQAIIVLPYPGPAGGNFIHGFFDALGHDVSDAPDAPRSKNPSLDLIDCEAKFRLFDAGAPQRLLDLYNRFAFNTPLKTPYTFLHAPHLDWLRTELTASNERLIATYPQLAGALGDAAPTTPRPLDDEGRATLLQRLQAFRERGLDEADAEIVRTASATALPSPAPSGRSASSGAGPGGTLGVYANCQAHALARMLQVSAELTARYRVVRIDAVHSVPEDRQRAFLADVAPHLDVLLHQPVREGFRSPPAIYGDAHVRSHLKDGAMSISFPSLQFHGYHPSAFVCPVTNDEAEALSRERLGLASRELFHFDQITRSYLAGTSVAEAVEAFDAGSDEDADVAARNAESSLRQMREAEETASIDARASAFVEEHYAEEHLFHTPRHPTSPVLVHICRQVFERLGIEPTREELDRLLAMDPLGSVQYPMPAFVRRSLGLRFPEPTHFSARAGRLAKPELIEAYFALYERFDDKMWDVVAQRRGLVRA